MKIHHIGIACQNLEAELEIFINLGFKKQSSFIDPKQRVKGIFIKKDSYCLELLEGIGQNNPLKNYLKNNIKMYHLAFSVKNIESALEFISQNGGGFQISEITDAVAFKRICFFMLKNKILIEFVEEI